MIMIYILLVIFYIAGIIVNISALIEDGHILSPDDKTYPIIQTTVLIIFWPIRAFGFLYKKINFNFIKPVIEEIKTGKWWICDCDRKKEDDD